jgi:undecaprenyl-diphosphatase
MEIIWSVFLGIIQGLTEFFPVSSSGHLVVLPYILNFKDPGLSFDIALHAGTLVAIFIALFSDWKKLILAVFDKKKIQERKLILFLIITSVPGALVGYILEDKAKTIFRNPLLTALVLVIFGLILWAVDKYVNQKEKVEKMTAQKALVVGFSQALAIIPGVSRSGATITAGRALGFSREAAVRYSFLAAFPIIAGATVFGLRDVSASDIFSVTWIAGFIASLLTSIWAIKFLTKYVKNNNFNLFVWWRLGLAGLIIILYLIRG